MFEPLLDRLAANVHRTHHVAGAHRGLSRLQIILKLRRPTDAGRSGKR